MTTPSKEAQALILQEFGLKDGVRITAVVLPNIIKDFEQTLSQALAGAEISEEYRFDDREGSITLYGVRESEGGRVTKIKIHGKEAAF